MKFRKITKFLLIFPLALVCGLFFANDFALAEDCLTVNSFELSDTQLSPGETLEIKLDIKNKNNAYTTYNSKILLNGFSGGSGFYYSSFVNKSLNIDLSLISEKDSNSQAATCATSYDNSSLATITASSNNMILTYDSDVNSVYLQTEGVANTCNLPNPEDLFLDGALITGNKTNACNINGYFDAYLGGFGVAYETNLYIELTAQCADSYVAEGGVCVYECTAAHTVPNSTNNGCVCDDGYDNVNGTCLAECDTNEERVGTACVCKSGYKDFGSGCVDCDTVTGYNSDCTYCKDTYKEYPTSSGTCILCSNGEDCCATANYEVWNKLCVPMCGTNEERDVNGYCVCIDGYEEVDGVCVGECGANASRNDEGDCECNSGYLEEAGGVCTSCASLDGYTNSCVYCNPTNHWEVNADGTACECMDNYKNISGTCTLCSSLSGYTDSCVYCDPSANQEVSTNGDTCECVTGTMEDENECKACSEVAGYLEDSDTGECALCGDVANYTDNCVYCSIDEHRVVNEEGTACKCAEGYDDNGSGVCEAGAQQIDFTLKVNTLASDNITVNPIADAKVFICTNETYADCIVVGATNDAGQAVFTDDSSQCTVDPDDNTKLNCPAVYNQSFVIYYKATKIGYNSEQSSQAIDPVPYNGLSLSKTLQLDTCSSSAYAKDGSGYCVCDSANGYIDDPDNTGACVCSSVYKEDNTGACVVCVDGDGPEQGCCSEGYVFDEYSNSCVSATNVFNLYIKIGEKEDGSFINRIPDIKLEACNLNKSTCDTDDEYSSIGVSDESAHGEDFNFIFDDPDSSVFSAIWDCETGDNGRKLVCNIPRGQIFNVKFRALPSDTYTIVTGESPFVITWQSGVDNSGGIDKYKGIEVAPMSVCPVTISSVINRSDYTITWSWATTTTNNCIVPAYYEYSTDNSTFTQFNGANNEIDLDFDCDTEEVFYLKYCDSAKDDCKLINASETVNCACGDAIVDTSADEDCDAGDDASNASYNGDGINGCSNDCEFDSIMCDYSKLTAGYPSLGNYVVLNDTVRTCTVWDELNKKCGEWSNDPNDDPVSWAHYNDPDADLAADKANAPACSFQCQTGYDYNTADGTCVRTPSCGDGILDDDELCDKGANSEYLKFCGLDCKGGDINVYCGDYDDDFLNMELANDDPGTVSVKCLTVDNREKPTKCTQTEEPAFDFGDNGDFGEDGYNCTTNTCCFHCISSDYNLDDESCAYSAPEEEGEDEETKYVIVSSPIAGAVATWSNTKGGVITALWDMVNEEINDLSEKAFQSISRIGENQMQELEMRFRLYVGEENLGGYEQDRCEDNGFCQNLVRWKLSGLDPNTGEKISLYSTEECLYQGGSTICLQDFIDAITASGITEDGYITVSILSPEGVDDENNRQEIINFLIDDGGLVYPQLEFAFGETPEWAGIYFPKIMYQLRFRLLGAVADYEEDVVTIPDEYITITSEGSSQGAKQSVEVKIAPKKILPIFDYAIFQD